MQRGFEFDQVADLDDRVRSPIARFGQSSKSAADGRASAGGAQNGRPD
jgi:hypothetical protein